ncbi:MAG: HAD-IA family hydrolase [Actinomycetota bacterium]
MALLLVGVVAFSACQADIDVAIDVEPDGSGTVEVVTTLDAETSDGVLDLDLDADGLLLADLAQSGWVVEPPATDADGSTVVVATKDFGTAAQLSDIMTDLTGPEGVFRSFSLQRVKTFARVEYAVRGEIDTTGGLATFSDDDLVDSLGRSIESLATRYGAREDQVSFRVEVTMPGELQGEAPPGLVVIDTNTTSSGATTDDGADDAEGLAFVTSVWEANLADDEVVEISLSTATRDVYAEVLRGVAVVTGALALLAVFAQLLRFVMPDRRRRRSKKKAAVKAPAAPTSATATGEHPAVTADAADAPVDTSEPAKPKVIALDGPGVLYREGNDVHGLLVPFAREKGSTVGEEEIAAKARLLSLGRLTTSQFWAAIQVDGEAGALDSEYLAGHQLTPGIIKYLRNQRDDGVRVACITNDSATWANQLKTRHSLEGLIDPWVVSSSVGVRKPDTPVYEVLRRLTEEQPSSILIIDDDVANLDAARTLGFATAWFAPNGTTDEANDHAILRSFGGDDDTSEVEAVTV